ncbi:trimeric intracellular cation channel family protein [Pseudohongiella sp.]|uniref:Glycine transporter domain-containing protein n=1 Tax=marine sediment metagenome TaxID=412755 RepID=A0A0F9YIC3_9ZZZZ|nr:trimeric intracellular cation channel family protein [Pseudohongiella sp.]HDZ07849.1 trimeric intracellular cation channel family protein [Pseudohongiella sp.]
MLLYILDLVGVAVFAISGVLAARDRELDVLGVIVVAAMTAIGGGTLRDLLLDRHPIFWLTDMTYLIVIIVAALATIVYVRHRPAPLFSLRVADAFGLALFALLGASYAEAAQAPALIVILMGTMTGVTGGVLRDIVTARVPLIMQREIYASAAIAGVAAYLLMQAIGVPQPGAFVGGVVVVVALRLGALRWNLHLPTFR